MTTSLPPRIGEPTIDGQDPLQRCLAALVDAADAADDLGIATGAVRATHADAARRVGFPSDAYVLAFVGGTGVGKSSLLNALAGTTVSHASARRPTTNEPIAWVPADDLEALAPLLDWIGVNDVREHEGRALGPVAILDLPDMDSLALEHRERVEAILPRVDAVAWITDPEKYHDAVLADDFLRTWLPRLARQVVVINKADRVQPVDALRIRKDLEHDLTLARVEATVPHVPVLLTSAAPSRSNGSTPMLDTRELQRWLSEGISAKEVTRGRVSATARASGQNLAAQAGVDPSGPSTPYLEPADRNAAIEAASEAVLRALDQQGLERQAEAATRARARARGTGPVGRLTSLLYRASGRETSVADPEGYLLRWRERGSLKPAVQAIRDALAGPVRRASPRLRPMLASALEPRELANGLERAVDRAIRGLGPLDPPTSRWWPVLGFMQSIATIGVALSVAWLVIMGLGGPASGSVAVPIIGAVPTPFVLLVAFLVAGYLVARLLGAHAGWVGRRWAGRVRERVAREVRAEVDERGLKPLDALEEARHRLWTAVSAMNLTCGARDLS
jgi:GTP-binding protein EngB required for normal cell division